MGTTGLLVRRAFRREWRTLAVFALLTALTFGFALTALMGARRMHTAWDRLTEQTLAANAGAAVGVSEIDDAVATVAASPGVAGSGGFSWFPASVKGMPNADQHGLFAGLGPGFGSTVFRPLIEHGRRPDPGRADEVTVNAEYARLARLQVGDRVHLTGPGGIDQPATVVGIHRSSLDIGANGSEPSMMGTPAFGARWWPTLLTLPGADSLRPFIAIRFRSEANAPPILRRIARKLPSGAGIVPVGGFASDVTDGVNAATNAYLILAGTSAAGALLVLSLLLTRSLRGRRDDTALLAALGTTRRDRTLALWLPQAAAITLGAILAPLVATLASPVVRTGFTAVADPVGGIWVEVPLLLGVAAAFAALLLAANALIAWRASRIVEASEGRPTADRRLGWLTKVSAPAGIGVGAALGGARSTTRVVARSSLLTLALTLGLLVASLVWVSSAHELVADPVIQGWNFDATFQTAGPPGDPGVAAADAALRARRDVDQLASYRQASVSIHGAELDLFTLDRVRGGYDPIVADGRLPSGPGEIAIGTLVARQAGLAIGDRVVLPGTDGKFPTRVVGTVIFPYIGNSSLGGEIITTGDTFDRLVSEPLNSGYLVRLRPGADLDGLERDLKGGFTVVRPFSPPPVTRLHDANGITGALAVFFGLLAAGVFLFTMVTSTQRRRKEYAVVRAVGFTRRQVRAACTWHAAVLLVASALFALPLGVIAGRVTWRLSSRNLAIVHHTSIPYVGVAVCAIVAAVVGLITAVLVARGPARVNLAEALRAE